MSFNLLFICCFLFFARSEDVEKRDELYYTPCLNPLRCNGTTPFCSRCGGVDTCWTMRPCSNPKYWYVVRFREKCRLFSGTAVLMSALGLANLVTIALQVYTSQTTSVMISSNRIAYYNICYRNTNIATTVGSAIGGFIFVCVVIIIFFCLRRYDTFPKES